MTTRVVKTISVTTDVANWLAEKSRQNMNVSALVNAILEREIIKELEESL